MMLLFHCKLKELPAGSQSCILLCVYDTVLYCPYLLMGLHDRSDGETSDGWSRPGRSSAEERGWTEQVFSPISTSLFETLALLYPLHQASFSWHAPSTISSQLDALQLPSPHSFFRISFP